MASCSPAAYMLGILVQSVVDYCLPFFHLSAPGGLGCCLSLRDRPCMHTCSWLGSLHPRAWAGLSGCLETDWSPLLGSGCPFPPCLFSMPCLFRFRCILRDRARLLIAVRCIQTRASLSPALLRTLHDDRLFTLVGLLVQVHSFIQDNL